MADLRYNPRRPVPTEGRCAIVTISSGAGCDGRGNLRRLPHDLRKGLCGTPDERAPRTAKSCGPGAATLALRWRKLSRRQRGQKRPLPRGERV